MKRYEKLASEKMWVYEPGDEQLAYEDGFKEGYLAAIAELRSEATFQPRHTIHDPEGWADWLERSEDEA